MQKTKQRKGGHNDPAPASVADVPIQTAPPEPQILVVDTLGRKIEGNLAGLYLTIRRPSGRPMMKQARIEATTTDQDQATVTEGDITRPCWKIDIHDLWKQVDANKALIDATLSKFSVSAPMKGEHLVSMTKVGNCLVELNRLRDQRLALADEMRAKWATEIIPGLQNKFPQFFENQIRERLPSPESLRDRFDVYWHIRPLTPMNPDKLDFSALSESDARAVIDRNREFMDAAVRGQFQAIIDEVFVEVIHLCENINSGEYTFGKRRSGAITEIMNMLDRITNFGDFADPTVLANVDAAKATFTKYNLQQINSSETVQAAIKKAMKPLGESLKALCDSAAGRSRRAVSI